MVSLPAGTLLGNPLYVPRGDHLVREEASGGLWLAAHPSGIRGGGGLIKSSSEGWYREPVWVAEFLEGSLYRYEREVAFSIPLLFQYVKQDSWPTSMQELLDEGFVDTTTYAEVFTDRVDPDLHIPEHLREIFYVTALGRNRVSLIVRRSSLRAPKRELKTSLSPIPELT